jgi:hypothetical protein
MKPQVMVGIVLVALGAFILLRGLTFGSQRSVMRVGDLQASVEERRAVPPWVGGVAIVGGLVLLGAGVRKRGA